MAKGTGIEITAKGAVNNMRPVLDQEEWGAVMKSNPPYIHIAHMNDDMQITTPMTVS